MPTKPVLGQLQNRVEGFKAANDHQTLDLERFQLLGHLRTINHDYISFLCNLRQACSSHNSTWLWDECGDPLRAAAGKVTASKYIFEVTNFLENSCQPSCICVKQSVIFVFSQTSLKPPQKHWWSSLTISDCSFRWNWKYFLRIWWSDLSFSQFCIYFPGDFIRFAGRELLVSEMIFLMFFPPTSCSKTNRNFNRHLFLPKNWNNHAPPSLVPQPTCYWNSFLLICISDTLWFGVN